MDLEYDLDLVVVIVSTSCCDLVAVAFGPADSLLVFDDHSHQLRQHLIFVQHHGYSQTQPFSHRLD